MLNAAKGLLAQFWKSPKIPSTHLWIQKVWEYAAADKLSDQLQCLENSSYYRQSFMECWFSFFSFVESQDASIFHKLTKFKTIRAILKVTPV